MKPVYAYLGPLHEAETPAERAEVMQHSHVRHARYGTFAACIGTIAARDVVARCQHPDSEVSLGFVASGGPSHLETAWTFCEKYLQSGPMLVNPLMFPNTIFSAAASVIGAEIGAHAFSLTIGSDGLASAEALRVAVSMMRAGYSGSTVVAGLGTGGSLIRRCEREVGSNNCTVDAAIAIGLALEPCPGWDLKIFGVSADQVQHDGSSDTRRLNLFLEEDSRLVENSPIFVRLRFRDIEEQLL